jgi:thiamine pyrophosphate-dependent acetolactate synthase large subunit-like protein
MSIGYARATGKTSPLILHVQVGPANAALGVLDAYIACIPLLVFSVGHISGETDFKEILYGYYRTVELLREYCKYVYRIVNPDNADKVIRRALRLAETPPAGPVFLTVSQDAAEKQIAKKEVKKVKVFNPSPPESSVIRTAEALRRADRPVILTQRTRRREAVPLLVQLAEKVGAAVFEVRPCTMNFPSSHPLHQGFSWDEPSGMKRYVESSDLVLALDCVNPPTAGSGLNIHVSDNPFAFNEDADVNVFCLSHLFLEALLRRLRNVKPDEERIMELEARHNEIRRIWMDELKARFDDEPPSPQRVWFEINKIFNGGEDYVVYFAPGYSQALSAQRYLEKEAPGSYYSCLSAAMGAAGEAIGIQLAEKRRVICALGDFEAHVSQLPTLLWTCAHHGIPVIWIVLDNQSGAIVKRAFWTYGRCIRDKRVFIGMELDEPRTDWAKIAEANGVKALKCENAEDLSQRLREASGIKGPVLLSVSTQTFEKPPEGWTDSS